MTEVFYSQMSYKNDYNRCLYFISSTRKILWGIIIIVHVIEWLMWNSIRFFNLFVSRSFDYITSIVPLFPSKQYRLLNLFIIKCFDHAHHYLWLPPCHPSKHSAHSIVETDHLPCTSTGRTFCRRLHRCPGCRLHPCPSAQNEGRLRGQRVEPRTRGRPPFNPNRTRFNANQDDSPQFSANKRNSMRMNAIQRYSTRFNAIQTAIAKPNCAVSENAADDRFAILSGNKTV